MRRTSRPARSRVVLTATLVSLLSPAGLAAPELAAQPSLVFYPAGSSLDGSAKAAMGGFFERYSSDWEVRWDTRGDRPHLIQGSGIPLLPGQREHAPSRGGRPAARASDRGRRPRAAPAPLPEPVPGAVPRER